MSCSERSIRSRFHCNDLAKPTIYQYHAVGRSGRLHHNFRCLHLLSCSESCFEPRISSATIRINLPTLLGSAAFQHTVETVRIHSPHLLLSDTSHHTMGTIICLLFAFNDHITQFEDIRLKDNK